MIKLIREGSKKYPWILKIIMLVIGVTFVIGMGWFGFDNAQQPNVVAAVGPYTVDAREFRDVYNRTYDAYKDQIEQEEMTEDDLKLGVVNSLVARKLWLVVAEELNIAVHPDELREIIMEREEFQKDGIFDPKVYHRLMAANRTSPAAFERGLTEDLIAQKVRLIVQDVATLNPAEMEEVNELIARQTVGMDDEKEIETLTAGIRLEFLMQKRQLALEAFQAAMRRHHTADVEIYKEFL